MYAGLKDEKYNVDESFVLLWQCMTSMSIWWKLAEQTEEPGLRWKIFDIATAHEQDMLYLKAVQIKEVRGSILTCFIIHLFMAMQATFIMFHVENFSFYAVHTLIKLTSIPMKADMIIITGNYASRKNHAIHPGCNSDIVAVLTDCSVWHFLVGV